MTSFRIAMRRTNSTEHIYSLAYFSQRHLVFEVDHFCWLINSVFLCSIKSPNSDVGLPGIRILMIETAPEKSLLFLATDISSLNNSCFLRSFHQCHILSRDFCELTHEWERLQNMLQKSVTGRQEIWNRLSEQETFEEISRSRDKAKLLKCALKFSVIRSAA